MVDNSYPQCCHCNYLVLQTSLDICCGSNSRWYRITKTSLRLTIEIVLKHWNILLKVNSEATCTNTSSKQQTVPFKNFSMANCSINQRQNSSFQNKMQIASMKHAKFDFIVALFKTAKMQFMSDILILQSLYSCFSMASMTFDIVLWIC